MVGGGWVRWFVILLLAFFCQRGQAQDCWESCFGPDARDDQYKDEYREILELISNLRSASGTSGGGVGGSGGGGASNGTVFLLDTSIPDSATDPKQTLVLTLMRKLSQIIAFTTPSTTSMNPLTFIKFDGERAWYCYEWACLGRCDAYSKLETEYDQFSAAIPKENFSLLDDACKAGANALDIDNENEDADNHIACHQYSFNEMVVAFVNSPFQNAGNSDPNDANCAKQEQAERNAIKDLDGRGGFDEFLEPDGAGAFGNWCDRKFAKRAVVGTLYADEDDMESFATVSKGSWPGSSFLREDEDLLAAADAIASCMNQQCCADNGGRRKRQATGDSCVEYRGGALTGFSPS